MFIHRSVYDLEIYHTSRQPVYCMLALQHGLHYGLLVRCVIKLECLQEETIES